MASGTPSSSKCALPTGGLDFASARLCPPLLGWACRRRSPSYALTLRVRDYAHGASLRCSLRSAKLPTMNHRYKRAPGKPTREARITVHLTPHGFDGTAPERAMPQRAIASMSAIFSSLSSSISPSTCSTRHLSWPSSVLMLAFRCGASFTALNSALSLAGSSGKSPAPAAEYRPHPLGMSLLIGWKRKFSRSRAGA